MLMLFGGEGGGGQARKAQSIVTRNLRETTMENRDPIRVEGKKAEREKDREIERRKGNSRGYWEGGFVLFWKTCI